MVYRLPPDGVSRRHCFSKGQDGRVACLVLEPTEEFCRLVSGR